MMMNKFLYNLTKKMPCRLITLPSGPYLERYYVGRFLGKTIYLHRFVRSDSELHLHNHPFNAVSIVLCGNYKEAVATDFGSEGMLSETKKIRWYNRIDSNKFHRIIAVKKNTWTLFIHGERVKINHGMVSKLKGWGFIEGLTFVPQKISMDKWWETFPLGKDSEREAL